MNLSCQDGVSCVFQIICCVVVYPAYLALFQLLFQPAARKGAEKSGPGAGFTVLSEKTLFLGQKVSVWQNIFF